MINVMISGRRREGESLDAFYNEFESTHVKLMREAHSDRFLKRYVQNKTISAPKPLELWAKIDKHFDAQACLAFSDMQKMGELFSDSEYNQIVKPHEFTDPYYMTFELGEERKIKGNQLDDSAVKVIYYLKVQPNFSRRKFRELIDGPYSDLGFSSKNDLLVFHMRTYCLPEEQTLFAKSAFQKARISQYGLVEELWFKDFNDLQNFHQGSRDSMHRQLGEGIDFANSFSLLMKDRLVFGSRP